MPLRMALTDLLRTWLDECRAQVADYMASNGDRIDPAGLLDACPSLLGSPAVAAYVLDGKESTHEDRIAMVRQQPTPGG